MLQTLSNFDTKTFGPEQLAFEQRNGRFSELSWKNPAPWHMSSADQKSFDKSFSSFPFPSNFGSAFKQPFAEAEKMKSNDYAHLVSSLGVYCLQDYLAFHQRRVLQRLFIVVHELTRAVLTTRRVRQLELDLTEVLTETEFYFPYFINTINFHLLHHLPDQLQRAGPAPFHWMYPQEREFGRCVDRVQSVEETMARSSATSEAVFQLRVSRRLPIGREKGDPTMSPQYSKESREGKVCGAYSFQHVTAAERRELLALWRLVDQDLNSLWSRFEGDATAPASIDEWKPHPPLSEKEKAMCRAPEPSGRSYQRGHRNHVYLRAVGRDQKFRSTNCCMKVTDARHGTLYAIVDSFFVHRAYDHADAQEAIFCKVAAWCRSYAMDPVTSLQRVIQFHQRPDAAADAQLYDSCFCFLGDVQPIPVVLTTSVDPAVNPDMATVYNVFELGR
jgi:hypothetical protein